MVIAALDAGIGQKLVPNGETFDHCIEQRIISMTETVIGDAIMGVPIRIENILAMEGGSTLANGGLKLIQKISKYQPNHMINNKSNDPYTQAQADKKGIIKKKIYTLNVPDVQKETSDHNGSKYHNSVNSTSNKPATSANQNYHSDEVDLSNSWETSFMGEELKKVRDDTYNSIVHDPKTNHGQSYGSKNSTSSFSNTIKSFGNELNNGFWTDIDMINGFRSGFVQGGINVGQTWVAFGKGVINGNVGSVFGSMGRGIMDFGPNFKNANLIGKSYLTGEAISTVGFGFMSAYVAVALPYTEAVPMIKGAAKLMSKAGFFGRKSK